MPSDETLIALLPWLIAVAPFFGAALIYLVIPRAFALLGNRGLTALVIIAAVIVLLLEVRP